VTQDPHNLSAGFQQGASGDPIVPMTRRERRALEALQAQQHVADELERQVESNSPALQSDQNITAGSELETVVTQEPPTPAPAQPVLMKRDRSNRPPLAQPTDVSAEPVAAVTSAEPSDPVMAEVNTPASGIPAVSEVRPEKPVITEPPATTASLPAPISLMAQVSTSSTPQPAVKVRLKHKRRSHEPKIVAPISRKRRGAQIFSMVAMAFVAGLAIATSVPATALLSPEDVALQAEQSRLSALPFGDGQSVEGTGESVSAGRDGVSVTAAQAAPTMGAFSVKKLSVNVPVSNNGMQWPVREVKISSPFGDRNLFGRYNFHTGLDFDPSYGTPIYSVADGIVSLVENPGPTCGVAVFIEHNVDGTKFTSVYCHMVVDSPPVKAGDTVQKGQLVGNIGLTGVTTGPHLHLEIRINDVPIDPYAFLVQHAGKASNETRG
jgi:hypothetical protein